MKTMEYRVNFPAKAKKTTVMATSCWHYGNPAIHEEGVAKFLKKAKKYSWIHHGDVIEGITPYDKRFEKDAHEMSLMNSVQIAAGKIEEAQSSKHTSSSCSPLSWGRSLRPCCGPISFPPAVQCVAMHLRSNSQVRRTRCDPGEAGGCGKPIENSDASLAGTLCGVASMSWIRQRNGRRINY